MDEIIHERLYTRIPKMESKCPTDCDKCCTSVFLSDWEAERLGLKGHRFTPTKPGSNVCIFRSSEGCTMYEKRPFICRLFAATKHSKLRCPILVRADDPLSRIDTIDITDEYFETTHTKQSLKEIREVCDG